MYLDDVAAKIRAHVPHERIPAGDAHELFRLYAVLLRAKGTSVTRSDVHDAWSAWMADQKPEHESLVHYDELPESVRAQDAVFVAAIHRAAEQLGRAVASRPEFLEVLYPLGMPASDADRQQALDLYKIMVGSSEGLVSRRQGVNTFFLTMNGAILTAAGLIMQGSHGNKVGGWGISILTVTGALLCLAWRSLIVSFGQLNSGKFRVINAMERHLRAAIYAAEWEALARGEDPRVYRSFTSREIWVPNALLVLHLAAAFVAVLVAGGVLALN